MPNPELYAGNTILTFSGHYINVFDPDPDHICIKDIAHGLSHIPRFAGQTKKIISVAHHSIMVCQAVEMDFKMEALLHDASEAYLMDIPKPIKVLLPDYVALEKKLMKAISEKFKIPFPNSHEVKKADKDQMEFEHKWLRTSNCDFYIPLTPAEAKHRFLKMYDDIKYKRF